MKYIITATYKGRSIERVAFGDFQAFIIMNLLGREGCTNVKMKEDKKYGF